MNKEFVSVIKDEKNSALIYESLNFAVEHPISSIYYLIRFIFNKTPNNVKSGSRNVLFLGHTYCVLFQIAKDLKKGNIKSVMDVAISAWSRNNSLLAYYLSFIIDHSKLQKNSASRKKLHKIVYFLEHLLQYYPFCFIFLNFTSICLVPLFIDIPFHHFFVLILNGILILRPKFFPNFFKEQLESYKKSISVASKSPIPTTESIVVSSKYYYSTDYKRRITRSSGYCYLALTSLTLLDFLKIETNRVNYRSHLLLHDFESFLFENKQFFTKNFFFIHYYSDLNMLHFKKSRFGLLDKSEKVYFNDIEEVIDYVRNFEQKEKNAKNSPLLVGGVH